MGLVFVYGLVVGFAIGYVIGELAQPKRKGRI